MNPHKLAPQANLWDIAKLESNLTTTFTNNDPSMFDFDYVARSLVKVCPEPIANELLARKNNTC